MLKDLNLDGVNVKKQYNEAPVMMTYMYNPTPAQTYAPLNNSFTTYQPASMAQRFAPPGLPVPSVSDSLRKRFAMSSSFDTGP